MQFLSESQQDCSVGIEKIILKSVWKSKGAETILKKKDRVREITLPNLNFYGIAEVIIAPWAGTG